MHLQCVWRWRRKAAAIIKTSLPCRHSCNDEYMCVFVCVFRSRRLLVRCWPNNRRATHTHTYTDQLLSLCMRCVRMSESQTESTVCALPPFVSSHSHRFVILIVVVMMMMMALLLAGASRSPLDDDDVLSRRPTRQAMWRRTHTHTHTPRRDLYSFISLTPFPNRTTTTQWEHYSWIVMWCDDRWLSRCALCCACVKVCVIVLRISPPVVRSEASYVWYIVVILIRGSLSIKIKCTIESLDKTEYFVVVFCEAFKT